MLATLFAAYQPVWRAGFIWDDDDHVTGNACVVGPLGLKEIWTTSAARICPLVLSSFRVQHALWGLKPLPYHLVTLLMHGLAAVVLWRVLLRLQVPGAWFGAALWALHPVQVESAAWITELKNTQSGLFYMLTVLFFARARLAEAAAGERVVKTSISSLKSAIRNLTSAPSLLPIQFFWSSLMPSGQSRESSSSMRRWAYLVMRSIHWRSGRRSTLWPLAFHSSTSSLASTVPRSGDHQTGVSAT